VGTVTRCLYELIDYRHRVNETVFLLAKLRNERPKEFRAIVDRSFQESDPELLEKSMRRFTAAWHLLDGHTEGVGIETMISLLSAENPIHQYVAQTWLKDSAPKIERVIEPLVKDLFI
jgi:hypothetical protein